MCRAPNVIAYFYLKVSACFMPFCTSSATEHLRGPAKDTFRQSGQAWAGWPHPSFRAGKLISVKTRACFYFGGCVAPLWRPNDLYFIYIHETPYIHIYIHVSYIYDKAHGKCWHVDAALMSFACLSVLWPDCCSSTFFLMLCSLYRQAFDCVWSLWVVRWWLLFLSLIALAWQRL